jgi:hypothetical protein
MKDAARKPKANNTHFLTGRPFLSNAVNAFPSPSANLLKYPAFSLTFSAGLMLKLRLVGLRCAKLGSPTASANCRKAALRTAFSFRGLYGTGGLVLFLVEGESGVDGMRERKVV